MIKQLNPGIPLHTPKGEGMALFLIHESMEHNLYWVVAQNETGEIWVWDNTKVRADKNITLGRLTDKKVSEIKDMIG